MKAHLKVGDQRADPSGGGHATARAMAPADELRGKFQGNYSAVPPTENSGASESVSPKGKSSRVCATEAEDASARSQRLRTTNKIFSALRWIWRPMGIKPKCRQHSG